MAWSRVVSLSLASSVSSASLVSSVLFFSVACGGDDGGVASDAQPDAPPACTDFTTAEIGRCATIGGGFCLNADPSNRFAEVTAGEEIDMVQGFQGAPMIALALRTSGIDGNQGGSFEEHPAIAGRVFDAGDGPVASYFNSVELTEVDGEPGTLEFVNVFLIINGPPSTIDGMSVRAEISVVDKNGDQRCGDLSFIARSAI